MKPFDKMECPQTGDKLIALESRGNSCHSTGRKFECVYYPQGKRCPNDVSCNNIIFVTQLEYVTKRIESNDG
jgi:hypothetical protein